MVTIMGKGGGFVPSNNDEANGEILGRCNALHDWLRTVAEENSTKEWYKEPLDSDMRMVCLLLGFTDVLGIKMNLPEKEKASAANAD